MTNSLILICTYSNSAKAVKATKSTGTIQAALDWIEAHGDDDGDGDDVKDNNNKVDNKDDNNNDNDNKDYNNDDGSCLKCNQCGKLFGTVDFAQLHATKTGHDDFSQTTEALPTLTEAEREARLAELRARLAAKRAAEAELAAEEARQNELIRRKANREAAEMRRQLQEKEIQRAYEQRMREKREDAAVRARIKQQIEEDRQRVREREERERMMTTGGSVSPSTSSPPIQQQQQQPQQQQPLVKSEETRIQVLSIDRSIKLTFIINQVKLPDGQAIKDTFKATTTTLTQLHEAILERAGIVVVDSDDGRSWRLVIPFPRRDLNLATEGEETLADLGLCPSASLMLLQK